MRSLFLSPKRFQTCKFTLSSIIEDCSDQSFPQFSPSPGVCCSLFLNLPCPFCLAWLAFVAFFTFFLEAPFLPGSRLFLFLESECRRSLAPFLFLSRSPPPFPLSRLLANLPLIAYHFLVLLFCPSFVCCVAAVLLFCCFFDFPLFFFLC